MQRTHSAGTLAVQSSANFEESEAYFTPMAGEEVANRGAGSLLSGQRGNSGVHPPVRGIIRQQSFPRVIPFWLLWHRGGLNVRGWDSLSLRSLDSQPLSWSPLSSGLTSWNIKSSPFKRFLFFLSHVIKVNLLIRVQTTYHCQEEEKYCK